MTTQKPDITSIVPALTYHADFVPWSTSRNAAEDRPSLNWRITFTRGGASLTTDYMQGIGHLPGYQHGRKSVDQDAVEKNAAQSGVWHGRKLSAPDAADVMQSLLMDAEAMDYADFESWANKFGSDHDSRAAEKTYRACLDIGLKLRAMLGDEKMAALRELLHDL